MRYVSHREEKRGNGKGIEMGKKLTANDFEAMTIHEVAEVLLTLAQVLRRLPDVPVSDLLEQAPQESSAERLIARLRRDKGSS
jgi:hypothetical protein